MMRVRIFACLKMRLFCICGFVDLIIARSCATNAVDPSILPVKILLYNDSVLLLVQLYNF